MQGAVDMFFFWYVVGTISLDLDEFFFFFLLFFVTLEYSVGCGTFGRWLEQPFPSDDCLSVIVFDDIGKLVFSFLDDVCFCVLMS